ncbi:uncharacterized protein LOC119350430 [Triticum dicoccoides]|uniref:uncharacterized protein LOC119350430 n=1 Tax=Triticum dicoccoides TaxID=85692 RepID=UPI00188FF34D|nr:uncharacterized protein LOC119350430 [Triticum dicoccoides]
MDATNRSSASDLVTSSTGSSRSPLLLQDPHLPPPEEHLLLVRLPGRPHPQVFSSCESQSWFLVLFMLLLWNSFRKEYKEKQPNVKQVSVIGKASGEKWKSMSDVLENEKHAGALLLHTSGTISGAVVLLEATGVMTAVYGSNHKLSVNSNWLLRDGLGLVFGDVDILCDLKLLICGLVSYYGLIFFVLTLSSVRGKL